MTTSPTQTLTSTDLRERLQSPSPPLILDVRTPAEFETAHITGSYNVPLDVVKSRRADVIDRLNGDEIVFVCRSGQRAAQAQQLLASDRPATGRVLEGGLLDWASNGFDIERGTKRWELERQVRLVAGSIVLTSVVGSVAVPKLKWAAAVIGGGLTFAAVSNTCAMATALSKLPYNKGSHSDAEAVLARLGSRHRARATR